MTTPRKTFDDLEDLYRDAANNLDVDSRNKSGVLQRAKQIFLEVNPNATQEELEHFLFDAGCCFFLTALNTDFEYKNDLMGKTFRKITTEQANMAVRLCNGNKTKAAEMLGVHRKTVSRTLNRDC